MQIKFYNVDGSEAGERDYAIPSFDGTKGRMALRQTILALQANQRLGTHSTLNHREVHGTGKKPFRQKGTGRARQGSWNNNQHYHGAVYKGPKPRDYSQKVNRKVRTLALSRALFERAGAGQLGVIERWEVSEPKTRLFDSIISQIEPSGKVLVVDDTWADGTALAARNIKRVSMTEAESLNALDLARYSRIIFSEKGIERVLARVQGEQP